MTILLLPIRVQEIFRMRSLPLPQKSMKVESCTWLISVRKRRNGTESKTLRYFFINSFNIKRFHCRLSYPSSVQTPENIDPGTEHCREKASIAAQTKENFLANMSHEIRTP